MAFSAALDALVHVTDLLATLCTSLADRCAGFAVVRVVVTVARHEVDARVARGNTVEHQFDVRLRNVFATLREAMAGQHIGTRRLTLLAVLNAILLGWGFVAHSFCPVQDDW